MNLVPAYMTLTTSPFSRDSVKFSKIIHKALPVVAMLLGSKQSTDILEAIDFFVSAFEFGVQNSMLGVRRMLSLIWSGEATIREAVVAAYKRLYIEVRIRFEIVLFGFQYQASCLCTTPTLRAESRGEGSEARRRPQLGTSLPWSIQRSFHFVYRYFWSPISVL